MFDIVDTPFSYERGLIVCSSLQEFSNTKESTLHMIWNVDTAFLFCGADWFRICCYDASPNHANNLLTMYIYFSRIELTNPLINQMKYGWILPPVRTHNIDTMLEDLDLLSSFDPADPMGDNCSDGSQWIHHHFKQCVGNPVQYFGFIFGFAAIGLWLCGHFMYVYFIKKNTNWWLFLEIKYQLFVLISKQSHYQTRVARPWFTLTKPHIAWAIYLDPLQHESLNSI